MDMLGGAFHVGLHLQLGAELIAHRLKQRIVAYFYKVVSEFHSGEHQPVFIQPPRLLAVALHQSARVNLIPLLVKGIHQAGVLRQMANRLCAGLLGVCHIDDQILLLEDIARGGNDLLEGIKRFLDGIYPCQVDCFDQLTVGKLKFIPGAGDGVHEEFVKFRAADCPCYATDELGVNRVDKRAFLPLILAFCFLCQGAAPPFA